MKNFISCLFILLIGIVFYGAVLKGDVGNPTSTDLKSVPEYSLRDRGRIVLIENLIKNKSFALNREQADLAAPDAGYYKGNWFLLYPPGISVMAVPFYLIGTHLNLALIFTFGMTVLIALATTILIFLICRQILGLPIWAGIFASLVFGFASTSLGYATSLFQHHATAFFVTSGFYAVYQYNKHERWGFLWAIYVWFISAFAFFVDYPNLILMLPVILYLILASINFRELEGRYRLSVRFSLIATSIVFIGLTALHGYYNYHYLGSWTRLAGSLPGFYDGVDKSLDAGTYEQKVDKFDAVMEKKSPTNFLAETKIMHSANILLVSTDRGIFLFIPIFILSVFGIVYMARRLDLERSMLLLILAGIFLLYFSWGDPYAGWSFGPRYLIPAMPILAILVSYLLTNVKFRRTFKVIALLLFITSAGVAFLGAVTTNAVPPNVEAIYLDSKYGMAFNVDSLIAGKTNSYIYNHIFTGHITLVQYWAVLVSLVSLVAFFVLFILPIFEKRKSRPAPTVEN